MCADPGDGRALALGVKRKEGSFAADRGWCGRKIIEIYCLTPRRSVPRDDNQWVADALHRSHATGDWSCRDCRTPPAHHRAWDRTAVGSRRVLQKLRAELLIGLRYAEVFLPLSSHRRDGGVSVAGMAKSGWDGEKWLGCMTMICGQIHR